MNFFERQERARRNTWLLAAHFCIAVVLIVAAVDAVLLVAILKGVPPPDRWLAPGPARTVLGWGTGLTAAVIAFGSLLKAAQLSGGRSVAASLGGVLVPPDTTDPARRRLYNVVEEMALASGVPVPFLYVLPEERGINAFAAGTSPVTASIAVSQGALDALTRDELQGVVAHEFSHIFNGDMRLNVRLIALLEGILLLAVIGRGMMRGSSSSSRRRKGGGGGVLIGLALLVIGYIGVFFARLIKSAISRQREHLADASAVQFTRNPQGLLGALLKIRNGAGSRLASAKTEEVSHMLFAAGLSSVFATHPPIDERIRAIDPSADLSRLPPPPPAAGAPGPGTVAPASAVPAFAASAPAGPAAAAAAVGAAAPEALPAARQVIDALPEDLHAVLGTAPGARAACYSLLLEEDAERRGSQLAALGEEAGLAERARGALAVLGPRGRFPVLSLSVPALRGLSAEERDAFFARLRAAAAPGGVSVAESLVDAFLRRALGERAPGGRATRADLVAALSALAHAGHPGDEPAAMAAFARGAAEVPGLRALPIPALELDAAAVPDAVGRLAEGDPEFRRRVLAAAAACALSDGAVTDREWETLRIYAAAMDCPLPMSV